jgi:NADPH2:quinone reductase
MAKVIRVHEHGGPEVLRYEDVDVPAPGPGEASVRHTAIGVNYVDTYYRTGLYPSTLPTGLGTEGAGTVEAVGSEVGRVRVGQRVAYAGGAPGAYSERRTMPADRLVPLPDEIGDEAAAAMMLKGMTAQYLLRRTYRVEQGDTILVHAAAGGVGLIMCQWAKHLGATVIGTVGSDAKAAVARAHGCDHVIVYTREDFAARVKDLTDGEGLPVVYDSVGRTTWEGSLDCLRPFGLMVSFGNASGPVAPFSPLVLAQKGSLYLTRPTLVTHTARREDLLASATELFAVVTSGAVKIEVNQRFPLTEAARAHAALEGRQTTGSTVLLP